MRLGNKYQLIRYLTQKPKELPIEDLMEYAELLELASREAKEELKERGSQ